MEDASDSFDTDGSDNDNTDDSDDTDDSVGEDYESPHLAHTCRVIPIQSDKLETTVRIDGLQPCTLYTFTMYTRHMVGDKRKEVKEEKMITEMTKCSGENNFNHFPFWLEPASHAAM